VEIWFLTSGRRPPSSHSSANSGLVAGSSRPRPPRPSPAGSSGSGRARTGGPRGRWLALLALPSGLRGWCGATRGIGQAFLRLAQPVAAALLVPSPGPVLYKRAIPQVARDEADGARVHPGRRLPARPHPRDRRPRHRRRAARVQPRHRTELVHAFRSRNTNLIDVLLPAFLLLFMLPSVAYAWMYPRREDGTPGEQRWRWRWRLGAWLRASRREGDRRKPAVEAPIPNRIAELRERPG